MFSVESDFMPFDKEYQDECLLCRMINKKEPCDIVMESKKYLAIYYTVSRNIGHTLVFPKKHCKRYEEIQDKTSFYNFIDSVHNEIVCIYEPDSTSIKINNGSESGQLMSHICCHIIPHYKV